MASALVNNVGPAPEGFLDCPPSSAYSSYGWLSPRISFSRDFADDEKPQVDISEKSQPSAPLQPGKATEDADLDAQGKDLVVDFEFRCLDDPVAMLPADELFSDGKLVPLQLASVRAPAESSSPLSSVVAAAAAGVRSREAQKSRRRTEASGSDPYVLSPRAPRCSSRWRELLGLKRGQSNGSSSKPEPQKSSSSTAAGSSASATSKNANTRILKHFLHRSTKSSSSNDSSLSVPLLRDSDSESVSISSRLSLSSSSSSGPDHEDLPRLSLDSDKPSSIPVPLSRNPPRVRVSSRPRTTADPCRPSYHQDPHHHNHPAAAGAAGRVGRSPMRRAPDAAAAAIPSRGASVDSPRMNSSGKVVFQSLERSSSSPSSFNGGPRVKHRGMERSYSANVRVKPVLNVPICSLRGSSKFGFGQLFSSSPQKKDTSSTAAASGRCSSSAAKGSGGGGKSERAKLEV